MIMLHTEHVSSISSIVGSQDEQIRSIVINLALPSSILEDMTPG